MSRLETISSAPVVNSTQPESKPYIITREHLKSNYLVQVVLTAVPLITGDFLAVAGAVYAASGVCSFFGGPLIASRSYMTLSIALAVTICYGILRLYPGVGMSPVAELRKTTGATLMVYGLLSASAWISSFDYSLVNVLILSSFFTLCQVPVFRLTSRSIGSRCSWWGQPLIIFGGDEAALKLYKHYDTNRELGFRPVAIVENWWANFDEKHPEPSPELFERASDLIGEHHVHWAVVTTPVSEKSSSMISAYLSLFSHVLVVPCAGQLPCEQRQTWDCAGFSAILITNRLSLPFSATIKRTMDLAIVLSAGLFVLPILSMIMLITKLTSPGPVFFGHTRIGKGNKPFKAWKIRTMCVNGDEVLAKYLSENPEMKREWEEDRKLKKDPRVTWIGNILRKTSLDELPQLWNILRGEMSLVGPRPIITDEISKYQDAFQHYLRATPGITGLWQISGRNLTTYDERVSYDTCYVQNWSPWFDLYILIRTIKVVLWREGAY